MDKYRQAFLTNCDWTVFGRQWKGRWAIFATVLLLSVSVESKASPRHSGLRVTGLDATITSMSLPLPGSPETGPISATLCTECDPPGGLMDCNAASGTIYWPVLIDFPLLETLGRPPIETIMVGPWITDPGNCGKMFAFDIGFVDHPDLGPVFHGNNNKSGMDPVPCEVCTSGGPVSGDFFDISQGDFESIEQPWLRSAMDRALLLLRELQPGVPSLPPTVLDTMFAMYCADPATEIILYFPDSGEFRSAQLTGTNELLLGGRIPTVSEWGLVVLALLLLTGAKVYFRQRRRALA